MTDTIIFDFDGTVARGDGPIRAFARAAGATLPAPAGQELTDRLLAALDRAAVTGFSEEERDGYGLVHLRALAAGVTEEGLDAAYHRSRSVLGSEEAPIVAPEGLHGFLSSLDGATRAVLVTNAPDIRIDEALEALGLAGCFDQVMTSARKPDGLPEIVAPWAGEGRLLSVGDIWINDLAPVARLGGDTAFIGTPSPSIAPTFVAPTLEELLPALSAWVDAR